MWYKCLVCHTCFESPKGLIVHRMKSQCRFKYKKIHLERSNWPFQTPLLENLEKEDDSRLWNSLQLLKSQKIFKHPQENDILEPTGQNQDDIPDLSKKSINMDLIQVMNCAVAVEPHPMSIDDQKRVKSADYKPKSFNFDKKDGMESDELKSHQIPTSGSFNCNLCQKSYFSKRYLQNHISAVHEGLKRYSCTQCPKSFSRIGNLRSHISAVHKGLQLYSCKLCQTSFSLSGNLRRHTVAVHKQPRKYSCTQCSKTFTKIRSLKTHFSAVHEGLKPYSCTQCSKTFSQIGNLRSHISAVHKGLKPYSCTQCPKTFSFSGNLRRHTSAVHGKLKMSESTMGQMGGYCLNQSQPHS